MQVAASSQEARSATLQLGDPAPLYNVMAQWYWRAHDKAKAIETQKKGIAELKSKNNFSVADLAELESDLSQYLNN